MFVYFQSQRYFIGLGRAATNVNDTVLYNN